MKCYRINEVYNSNVKGIKKFPRNVANSFKRFASVQRFIETNRQIPNFIIGTDEGHGIHIEDGHHRLAALLHLGLEQEIEFTLYVGS